MSASLEQSRVFLGFVRASLADVHDDYRWLDSGQRLAVTHKATHTKLRILSSSGRRAMGLATFSTIYADEPGAWEARGGELMWNALRQSLGKRPGQRLILIGTRAPAEATGWWPALIDAGSGAGTHVTELSAPQDAPWDDWNTIRRVNPLVMVNAALRKWILRERDEARRDASGTLRRSFLAYRLNMQIDTYAESLVSVDDWMRVEAREIPPRLGRPIVGLDLGAERSWSAVWCLWENGRSECYALVPGIPTILQRERQDAKPRGLYRRLVADGVLLVDEDLRYARHKILIDHLLKVGIRPAVMFCDRFALGSLRDAVANRWPIVTRKGMWSESTEDVTAFRRLVADGPLSIVPECQALARLGLSEAIVDSDQAGRAGSGSGRITALATTWPWRPPSRRVLSCENKPAGRGRDPRGGSRMRKSRGTRSRAWERTRLQVIERDRCCVRCGFPGRLEVHHRIPVHAGGDDSLENLEALCRSCHISEHRSKPSAAAWRALVESTAN